MGVMGNLDCCRFIIHVLTKHQACTQMGSSMQQRVAQKLSTAVTLLQLAAGKSFIFIQLTVSFLKYAPDT